ncbi:hypothetical protein ATANTOWER_032484 [Ataeniobius toweri]|uniref:Uncharacterized protein n=1 Tax=Ataeniobius toweri TaxID=208326 RepID=A0ABU7BBX7_9TELE|nr:hypothetical protein [Ataeniobius toweri]
MAENARRPGGVQHRANGPIFSQQVVQHKRINPVQQEAKSGATNILPRPLKYLTPAKRQRLSALQSNACERFNERGNVDGRADSSQTRTATSQKECLASCTGPSE